jgi:iron complex outermembrane recepter protein
VGIKQPLHHFVLWSLMTVASFVLPNSVLAEIKTFDKDTPTGKQLNSSPNLAPDTLFKVTGVKLNRKDNKIEVILETSAGQKLQPTSRTEGNTFIVDIPNGKLFLASGSKEFVTNKPLDGISSVTVTQLNNNTIQLRVTGEAGLPQVELFDGDEGLIFAVAPANITQAPQQEAPQTTEKPATEAPQEKPAAQQDDPIELVMTGEQDGYRVQEATTATRTNTRLRDIPQSIQVIPQQVIQDQQATRLVEVLKNAPGVVLGDRSPRDPLNIINIRGFNASSDILINGLPDPTSSEIAFGSNIERVEVIKGPASVLFGQGGLGGSVNLVTKQPLLNPFYSVEASAGSYNLYRGAIDLSGPLNESKTVLYRLNASAQTRGSFIDFYGHRDYLVAPTFAFQLGDKTKLTLTSEYALSEGTYDFGLPPRGTVLPNPNGKIPRNRSVGEPNNQTSNEVFRIGYDFEHRFSDEWQARSVFRASLFRVKSTAVFPLALQSDGRTLNRGFAKDTEFSNNTYNLDNYIIGNFATGSIKHQLVAGFNLRRTDTDSKGNYDFAYTPLDIFNPVYGRTPTNPTFEPDATKDRVQQLGIYLQNQITLAENLKLLLGGRFDIANQNFQAPLTQTTDFKQTEAFSPRVGIVYQPIQPISLYASYSRSFNYSTSSGFAPAPTEPERGTQYEIGVKADLTNRLAATLALYNLTRSNLPTSDPDNPTRSILVGEQRSRGIEFDVSGEILPGWNVIAGYAFTDTEVTKDNDPDIFGDQLNNVPKHALNLWTTYEIQSGSFKGLGFGFGAFFYGDRKGDLPNTFELPGYTRADASIFYKRDNFRAAINIRNLFDVDYFVSAQNRNRVIPGDPLTVQGTISWQF